MNFKKKQKLSVFLSTLFSQPVPPLSYFAVRAGMRGRQRIWDSEEEKKGEKIISVLFLKFISVDTIRAHVSVTIQ